MSGKSNYLAPRILDHITGNATYNSPSLFLALSTTVLTAASSAPSEPAGGNYARQALAMTAASGQPAQTSNQDLEQFTATGAAWAQIESIAIMDALSSGNIIWWAPISNPTPVNDGETLEFAIGAITVTET